MINFRYHMVSLAAVLLTLAIGTVFGTAIANGPASDGLSDSLAAAHRTSQQLRETTNELQEEAGRKDDYIGETASTVLSGVLAGRRIAVVTTPTGHDHAPGVIEKLKLAGAEVTGRVDVREAFLDPDNNLDLLALAHRTGPADALPANGDGVETSGALLATALLGTAAQPSAVLSAYARAGYLTAAAPTGGPADAVVLVTGPAYVERDATERNSAVVTLAVRLGTAGRVVVAGTSAGDGSAIASVRGDDALAARISTVDGVAGVQGDVVTALALAERVTTDRVGHYGTAASAERLMPQRR